MSHVRYVIISTYLEMWIILWSYFSDETDEELLSSLASIQTIFLSQGTSNSDSPTCNILPIDHWMWIFALKIFASKYKTLSKATRKNAQHCTRWHSIHSNIASLAQEAFIPTVLRKMHPEN